MEIEDIKSPEDLKSFPLIWGYSVDRVGNGAPRVWRARIVRETPSNYIVIFEVQFFGSYLWPKARQTNPLALQGYEMAMAPKNDPSVCLNLDNLKTKISAAIEEALVAHRQHVKRLEKFQAEVIPKIELTMSSKTLPKPQPVPQGSVVLK